MAPYLTRIAGMCAMRINKSPRLQKFILSITAFAAVLIVVFAAYSIVGGGESQDTELSAASGAHTNEFSTGSDVGGATTGPAATSTSDGNQSGNQSGDLGEDNFWFIGGGSGDSASLQSVSGGPGDTRPNFGFIRGYVSNFPDNCLADNSSPCAEIFAYRADRLEVVDSTSTGTLQNGIIVGLMGNAFSFDSLPVGTYKLLAKPAAVIYNNNIAGPTVYEKTWYDAGYPTRGSPGNDVIRRRYINWSTATTITVTRDGVDNINIIMNIAAAGATADTADGSDVSTDSAFNTVAGTAAGVTNEAAPGPSSLEASAGENTKTSPGQPTETVTSATISEAASATT